MQFCQLLRTGPLLRGSFRGPSIAYVASGALVVGNAEEFLLNKDYRLAAQPKQSERLAPSQISAVVHLLEVMTDPVARSLANAPVDDELITEEEARKMATARASLDSGVGIPHGKLLAQFGLTSDDLD